LPFDGQQVRRGACSSFASAPSTRLTDRAGKSSCIKTIFQDVAVKDVPFFGVTQRVEKIDYE
jgi:hypothetical protein